MAIPEDPCVFFLALLPCLFLFFVGVGCVAGLVRAVPGQVQPGAGAYLLPQVLRPTLGLRTLPGGFCGAVVVGLD